MSGAVAGRPGAVGAVVPGRGGGAGAEAVKVRVGQIAEREMPSVQERIDRARIAEGVEGNVRAATRTFVGRKAQMRALHDAASLTTPGTVALIHGPGGFGKTELAVANANEYRAEYGGGVADRG